jgi:hypothetical protein
VIAAELRSGRVLGTTDFGRFSPPLRHLPAVVLRHQLQEHLLAAARANGVEVRFGHRVVAASAAGDAAVLGFAHGASEPAGIVLALAHAFLVVTRTTATSSNGAKGDAAA